jgi:hypothetical protein
MPKFPTNEPQIMAFAKQMIDGYRNHRLDFPNAAWQLLNARYLFYKVVRNLQTKTKSQLRLATKAKDISLRNLKSIMKQFLQKAEVDTAANPEKLKLIGWGPKPAFQPIEIPGQPTELAIDDKQNGVLDLRWKKPADGGTVYNYIIERRCQNTDLSDNWTLAAISYGCRITLADPPKGIKLEYRVSTSNLAGQSIPSNTAAITL